MYKGVGVHFADVVFFFLYPMKMRYFCSLPNYFHFQCEFDKYKNAGGSVPKTCEPVHES